MGEWRMLGNGRMEETKSRGDEENDVDVSTRKN